MSKTAIPQEMGIGNLTGYTNLTVKQKEIIVKIYSGFNSELEYLNMLFDIRSYNLGIPDDIYFILEQDIFYVFLLNNNQIEQESKLFYRIATIKILINIFSKTLNVFKDRAMEFDLFKFENEQVKGNIAYGGINELGGLNGK